MANTKHENIENQPNKLIVSDGFVAIPNYTARDGRLSIGARGLLVLLLSHADGWSFNRSHILKQAGCGRDKYYRMVNELKDAGYLKIEVSKKKSGAIIPGKYDWHISRSADFPAIEETGHLRRTIDKKNNIEETPIIPKGDDLFGEKPTSQKPIPQEDLIEANFNQLWRMLMDRIPPSVKTRHVKKLAKRKFVLLSKSHESSVLAKACLAFYHAPDVSKENYKYAPGLQVVLNQDRFEPFIGAKADTRTKKQREEEDYWRAMARQANRGGAFDRSPRDVPEIYRMFFNEELKEKWGWT